MLLSFEDPWWIARCTETEVAGQGRTRGQALAMLGEALELFFEEDGARGAHVSAADL